MELEMNNLTKKFGDFTAVKQLNLSMTRGVYGLLGKNGAGKTTFMRMLCTLLTPTEGNILCDGRDIFKMEGEYRKLLGYLPQDFGFYPEFTVRDYLLYIASIKGLPPAVAKKRTKELLAAVGLEKYAGRKMKKLSGGMKRRAGIAQAMMNHPKILILDEPTAGLDPRGRDEILDQISRLHRERHMTIILVSHSMEDVARYADRLLVMNHGKKVFDGTPREVFSHYKELEAMGLAAPQVTYLVHDLKAQGIAIDESITTVEEAREAILTLWRNKTKEGTGKC